MRYPRLFGVSLRNDVMFYIPLFVEVVDVIHWIDMVQLSTSKSNLTKAIIISGEHRHVPV